MFKNTKISTLVLLLSSTFLFLVNPLKAEAKPRRIAIFVDGNMDCCVRNMNKTKDAFRSMGIDVYNTPWNSFSLVSGSDSENQATKVSVGATKNFVNQLKQYLAKQPKDTEIYLVGHSFGGDSILQFLNNHKRNNVKFKFVAVLDAVGFGAQRSLTKNNTVGDNVEYFYNRWQTNFPWPVDIKNSGNISCKAKTCNQKEQSISRHPDGRARKTRCGHLENCPGKRIITQGIKTRIEPGHKQTRLHHQYVPTDPLIETQIINIVKKLARENDSGIVPSGLYRKPNGTFISANNSGAFCSFISPGHFEFLNGRYDLVKPVATKNIAKMRDDGACPVRLSPGVYRLADGRIITSNGKAYCRYTSPEHYHKADGRPITQLADGIPLFAMENHKDCPKKW